MNKKIGKIILYILIVVASLFILFRRYRLLEEPEGKTIMNYAFIAFFLVFTFINLRILLQLIKNYKK